MNTRFGHRRALGPLLALACLATLAGCASQRMDIRPQISANGQPAYELRGSNLQVLQAQVQRLCPNGADVLRQTQRFERPETEPGFVKRWTVELIDPPHTEAQMQVVCRA